MISFFVSDPTRRYRQGRAACSVTQTVRCTGRTRVAAVGDKVYVVDDTRQSRGLMRIGKLQIAVYDVTSRLEPPVCDPVVGCQSMIGKSIGAPHYGVAMPVKSTAQAPPVWPPSTNQPIKIDDCEGEVLKDELQPVASEAVRMVLLASDAVGRSELVDSIEVQIRQILIRRSTTQIW